MNIKADDITKIIREQIGSFGGAVGVAGGGAGVAVGDGVAPGPGGEAGRSAR